MIVLVILDLDLDLPQPPGADLRLCLLAALRGVIHQALHRVAPLHQVALHHALHQVALHQALHRVALYPAPRQPVALRPGLGTDRRAAMHPAVLGTGFHLTLLCTR